MKKVLITLCLSSLSSLATVDFQNDYLNDSSAILSCFGATKGMSVEVNSYGLESYRESDDFGLFGLSHTQIIVKDYEDDLPVRITYIENIAPVPGTDEVQQSRLTGNVLYPKDGGGYNSSIFNFNKVHGADTAIFKIQHIVNAQIQDPWVYELNCVNYY